MHDCIFFFFFLMEAGRKLGQYELNYLSIKIKSNINISVIIIQVDYYMHTEAKRLHTEALGKEVMVRQKLSSDKPDLKSSVQFGRLVVSDPLQLHGLQHARIPCPSPTPGAYSNSCPSRR